VHFFESNLTREHIQLSDIDRLIEAKKTLEGFVPTLTFPEIQEKFQ
jgi:hypothetical protein